MPQICLLTDPRFLNPRDPDPFIQQVFREEGLLSKALEEHEFGVERLSWDDPRADWSAFDMLVFRSTWDYMDRIGEFSHWLAKVSQQTRLLNPAEVIRWNMDKHYLGDLEQEGVRIPPTLFFEKGEEVSLESQVTGSGWKEVILKPVVSAGARHTHRLMAEECGEYEPLFRELIAAEAMMLQEFQESVLSEGELSLVMIGGRFSHAVRKKARPGDFRVQDDFGGSVESETADSEVLEFSEKVMDSCKADTSYARVDILTDRKGMPLLTELELIEPELWFRLRPEAADELAAHIVNEYHKHSPHAESKGF